MTITQAVIFCASKRKVIWLGERLNERDFTVNTIHGDLSDIERKNVMKEFRAGSSRILIATDLLARGIDVQQVSLVINYDMPSGRDGRENYIHRVGRSGRFGRKGCAINFVTKKDIYIFREIERFYSIQINELPYNINDLL